MPENDQYPAETHGTKLPVAVLLVAVVAVGVGVFAYVHSEGATDPTVTSGIQAAIVPAPPSTPTSPSP